MVFNGPFAATRDNTNVGQSGFDRFFNAILDKRFVDDGQHFFGHGLGGWQEASALTRGGEEAFGDHA